MDGKNLEKSGAVKGVSKLLFEVDNGQKSVKTRQFLQGIFLLRPNLNGGVAFMGTVTEAIFRRLQADD